jgi:hypothetical protein
MTSSAGPIGWRVSANLARGRPFELPTSGSRHGRDETQSRCIPQNPCDRHFHGGTRGNLLAPNGIKLVAPPHVITLTGLDLYNIRNGIQFHH